MPRDPVFIIDDDASVRDALSLVLSLRGLVTATFASAEDFLAAARPDWRGCLVVDIRMPGMSGLELQQRLVRQGPPLKVIVITAHGDVAAARQAFLAGAVDFVEKPFDADQLVAAIEGVLREGDATSPSDLVAVKASDAAAPISPREREVMELLVEGLHNRRIAEILHISPRTVEVHKARVLEKLGIKSVIELVRLVDRGQA